MLALYKKIWTFELVLCSRLSKEVFWKTNFYNGLVIFTSVMDDCEEFLSISWMLVKNCYWCLGCLWRIITGVLDAYEELSLVSWMLVKNYHWCLGCLWRIITGVLDAWEDYYKCHGWFRRILTGVLDACKELLLVWWMLLKNFKLCHGWFSRRILTSVLNVCKEFSQVP